MTQGLWSDCKDIEDVINEAIDMYGPSGNDVTGKVAQAIKDFIAGKVNELNDREWVEKNDVWCGYQKAIAEVMTALGIGGTE